MPADDAVMTDLLGAITGLRAAEWVSKDSAEVGRAKLEAPQLTVAFTTAAPATQPTTAPASQPAWTTIAFGQYEDIRRQRVFARVSDSPAVVKVASTALDTLTKKPLDIRDKKVLDLLPEQVSKLSIVTDVPGQAPTTKPASRKEVAIERRKEVAGAATRPAATQVATATQPATKPAATQIATTQVAAPTTQVAATTARRRRWFRRRRGCSRPRRAGTRMRTRSGICSTTCTRCGSPSTSNPPPRPSRPPTTW